MSSQKTETRSSTVRPKDKGVCLYSIFSERQRLFSVVHNEERVYLAACSRLEKKQCTQRLFSERSDFYVQLLRALVVENLRAFQKSAGVVTVAHFQEPNRMGRDSSLVTKKTKEKLVLLRLSRAVWYVTQKLSQQIQKSPFVGADECCAFITVYVVSLLLAVSQPFVNTASVHRYCCHRNETNQQRIFDGVLGWSAPQCPASAILPEKNSAWIQARIRPDPKCSRRTRS